jgi:AraC-like DNA-binding protein
MRYTARMSVARLEQQVRRATDGRWEARHVTPAADLRGLVLGYQGYVERGGPLLCQREVSTTLIPVIVNLGPPFRVGRTDDDARDLSSFVAGLDSGHATVASTGASLCMQIDLTPPGAYRLFGLPMCEWAGLTLPLDDFGRDFRHLVDRLAETPDWDDRFLLLDAFVRARLQRTVAPSAGVAWAWQRLRDSHGTVRIAELADQLGWSRKHLAGRFASEIGRPPKTVARLLRFERVHGLLGATASPDWSALAYDCGYADQSHLVRDFRDFTGTTPTRYLAELRVPRGDDGASR